MAKFLTIGYGDEAGYRRTAAPLRDAAHAHDAALRDAGAWIGVAGSPVQVRNPQSRGVQVTPGRYAGSDLPVAGFALIEADSLQDAVAAVAKTPCAVACGVVEVWPVQDMP